MDKLNRKFIDDVAVFGSTSHDYVSSIGKFTCPVCGSDKELALYDPVKEDYDGRFFTSTETFTCCDCGSEFEVTSVYRRECVYVSNVTDNRFYEED